MLLASLAFAQSQRILQQPADTKAVIGATVLLRCQVENQISAITWTKNKFILGSSRSLPAYPRYSMVGSSVKGEYHLEIKNVSLSDDAVYQCTLAKGVDQPEESSQPVRLTVIVPPTYVQLANNSVPASVNEDDEQLISCTSGNARPAASIQWKVSSTANGSEPSRLLDNDHDSKVQAKKHGFLYSTTSTIRRVFFLLYTSFDFDLFLPKAADDGHFIVCEVRHEALESPLTSATKLNIRYRPKVSVKLVHSQSESGEKTSWLVCDAEGKPNETMRYEWRMDNKILKNAKSSQLHLPDAADQKEGTEYICTATNSVGSGNGSFSVTSRHAPKALQKDTTIKVVDEGSTVTLECKMDGNPPPTITWNKLGENRVLHKGSQFVIEKVRTDHQGNYRCDGFVPGFPVQSLNFVLNVNGPPSVNIVSSLWNSEQRSAEIVCAVVAHPAVKSIQWLRNQQPIDFRMSKNNFEKYELPKAGDVVYSKLKVYKLDSDELGVFNCTAYNDYGSNSSSAQLYLNDNMSLYVMVPGVVGGCVAILILAFALILMNHKHLCGSKMSVQSDVQSDFTIKVEALDGNGLPLPYYCDLYGENADGVEILRNKKNGQLPQMRYADDTALLNETNHVNGGPNYTFTHHNHSLTSPNSTFFTNDLVSVPYRSLASYCDQNYLLGFVPMQLETLAEVPTPDAADEQREMASYMPRCPSQSSTHV
ncbi:unnamed protein product [Soboliphyme baturini]|uniref:Nephrin n=1 Tax=Soboliphyme baturini TaxID=241478 RepID=A0A183IB14_9BILA|nr:unnamed protein product [Soboliphyme baturini]